MTRAPLRLLEQNYRRYGDVFRLEILGPRYPGDPGLGPLARRSVVVFSGPDQVEEIFARSGEELLAGQAQRFLEWFLGPRSLMVLDGPEHLAERRALLSVFTPERLDRCEAVLRQAAVRSIERWPEGRGIDLGLLVGRALESMNLELALGPGREDVERLTRGSRRARNAFSAPILFVPLLRSNLGSWSPGGQLAGVRRVLRELVLDHARGRQEDGSGFSLLSLLLELQNGRIEATSELELLLDRMITVLGGMDNASAAVAWTCHHLVRHPEALERATDEVRAGRPDQVPGPDSWLEAVCKESLRLHPPFPVVVRKVARPTSIGGITLSPGDFVMGSMYLMHRRPDLFEDPEAFRPERFLGRSPQPGTYAPFGSGLRRCLGSALGSRQMRVVLSEVLRRFTVTSEGVRPLVETRRNVTVVPATPLSVTLRRADAAGTPKPIPGPRYSAFVQTLRFLIPSVRRSERPLMRFGDIGQVRVFMPTQSGDGTRRPVITRTIVFVAAPDLLRDIFTTASPALAGGAGRHFAEWFFGSKSLLVLDGEEHLSERRDLLTLFAPERVSRYEGVMRTVTEEILSRLPVSGRLRLGPLLDEVILATSVRLMFGQVDPGTLRRLQKSFALGLTSLSWSGLLLLFPALRKDLGRFSPGGRIARMLAEMRELLAQQVERIRADGAADESWLAQLLALEDGSDDPAVRERRFSRAITIQAGTGTVAGQLRWCCYHLLQDPEALGRAGAEARSGGPLTYLEAVCKESARIHPAIPIFARRVVSPVQLGEYRVEPGSYVVGGIKRTHRRPSLYPDPERFRPERFLERSFTAYEYLPFGGGVRRCLGQAISFRQMTLVMAALLRAFDLRPIGRFGTGEESFGVVTAPTDPLRVVFERRE